MQRDLSQYSGKRPVYVRAFDVRGLMVFVVAALLLFSKSSIDALETGENGTDIVLVQNNERIRYENIVGDRDGFHRVLLRFFCNVRPCSRA